MYMAKDWKEQEEWVVREGWNVIGGHDNNSVTVVLCLLVLSSSVVLSWQVEIVLSILKDITSTQWIYNEVIVGLYYKVHYVKKRNKGLVK